MNILVIEDTAIIAQSLKNILKSIDLVNIVQIANTYELGVEYALSEVFDVIVIDIMLGHTHYTGLDLCRSIRAQSPHIPIIMITGHHTMARLEQAFQCGANDYITKPFNHAELRIRVHRWASMYCTHQHRPCLQYEKLTYNIQENEFYFGRGKMHLSKKSKLLLALLIESPEKLVSKEYLQRKLWGDEDIAKNRNIRSNIQTLRGQLPPYIGVHIRTVHGEGYILEKGYTSILQTYRHLQSAYRQQVPHACREHPVTTYTI